MTAVLIRSAGRRHNHQIFKTMPKIDPSNVYYSKDNFYFITAPFGFNLFYITAQTSGKYKEMGQRRIMSLMDMLNHTEKLRALCAHDLTKYASRWRPDGIQGAVDVNGNSLQVDYGKLDIAPVYTSDLPKGANYNSVLSSIMRVSTLGKSFVRALLTPEICEDIPQVVLDRASKYYTKVIPSYLTARMLPRTDKEIAKAAARRLTDPETI